MNLLKSTAVVLTMSLLLAGTAQATVIRGATSAVVVVGNEFGPCCDIGNAIDQSGLSSGYTSGVTDFDTYIGSNPMHAFPFNNNEYFAMSGTTSGVVEFQLDAIYAIDRIALWNEDANGISVMDVLVSTDGVIFSEVLSDFVPMDNPINFDYPAEVISLGGTVNAKYVRIDMNSCPSPFCSIGEIAFSTSAVPEPTTVMLLGLGLAGLGFARRRRH